MKIIGLTGGIGSGKSFVAGVAEKNFPILHISTDEIARRQMQKGGVSFKGVVDSPDTPTTFYAKTVRSTVPNYRG